MCASSYAGAMVKPAATMSTTPVYTSAIYIPNREVANSRLLALNLRYALIPMVNQDMEPEKAPARSQ